MFRNLSFGHCHYMMSILSRGHAQQHAGRPAWKSSGACAIAVVLIAGLAACGGTSDDSDADLADVQTTQADDSSESTASVDFPIAVDASLEDFDVVGRYNLSMTEAYCDGLPNCGTNPADVRADIVQGSNGLELQVQNLFVAGLFSINGSLFAVTDSDQILPPCGETAVNAQISITMFADGVTIEEDGTESLTGIGASLLVAGDPAGDCGAGNVFYDAELIPA
jgi:hypothetical protein